jgi:hypothetical protein
MPSSFARQLVAYIAAIVVMFTIFLMLATLAAPARAQQATSDLVSGSGNATGTGATTIIAAPPATRRIYVTSAQCARTDTGTTAIFVTLNDDGATIIGLPNSGGGVPITWCFQARSLYRPQRL